MNHNRNIWFQGQQSSNPYGSRINRGYNQWHNLYGGAQYSNINSGFYQPYPTYGGQSPYGNMVSAFSQASYPLYGGYQHSIINPGFNSSYNRRLHSYHNIDPEYSHSQNEHTEFEYDSNDMEFRSHSPFDTHDVFDMMDFD
ncbi:hypothetical protein GJ496_000907 [Pomphorhynchus laevis]|nr:hypothetical protein GJ496_000907 [Pomphorhynchus laevis]